MQSFSFGHVQLQDPECFRYQVDGFKKIPSNKMSISSPRRNLPAHSSSRTETSITTYFHDWTITNISLLQRFTESSVKSCAFPNNPISNMTWYMTLQVKTLSSDEFDLSLGIHSSSVEKISSQTRIQLSVRNYNGNVISTFWDFFSFCETNKHKIFPMKCKRNSFPNDELLVNCKLEHVIPPKTKLNGSDIFASTPDEHVMNHFTMLFQNPKHADVTLVVGSVPLPAHKAILATCSPVFEAMFENEFHESKSGKVVISEFPVEAVKSMLCFFYTGEVPNLTNTLAMDLLKLADMYDVGGLKTISEEVLSRSFDVENVSEILCLSYYHNCPRLKESCLRFVKMYLSAVLKTESWSELERTNFNLVRDVLRAMAD